MIARVKEFIVSRRFLRSLRFRIFVIACLIGILPASILCVIVLGSYEKHAVAHRMSEVQHQCTVLADHLFTYDYLEDISNDIVNTELDEVSNIYDGRIMIIDSELKVIKDTYSISQGKYMIAEEVVRCFENNESTSNYDEKNNYIEMITPIVDVEAESINGVMLTSVSTEAIAAMIRILQIRMQYFMIAIVVIVLLISVIASRMLIKPFSNLSKAMGEVKEGFTVERLSLPDYIEMDALLGAFEHMVTEIKLLEASRQEFVSNVSHELKTPLTSIKVLADSLNMQDEVPNEVYKEFMQDIALEIDRENKTINDLMTMIKLSRNASPALNLENVNIEEMLEEILKMVHPIADKRGIELILEIIRPVVAPVDKTKLSSAITNIIENAIKYNIDNGWVRVVLDAEASFFNITISDSGIGIPESEQPHIFERFYRVDKSHSTEIDGTGLGLSISREAILLHNGAVKVESTEGEGTTFTIKIPR
ncbi:MAG: HAMP domain-containing histidine kinase [Lachnospiraceae bacterium]|nr:HAMP domain-containing histidine kinase [Lachnospiraceae bacterium]